MLTNIKRDFMFASFAVVAILGYGFCSDADAQTVQPVYTRPSKGPVLTTFNATVSPSTVTSITYDWTAFSSANISLKFATAAGNRCSCPSGVDNCEASFSYGYKTSTAKTGPFGDIENLAFTLPLTYNPTAPVTEPAVFGAGQYNIGDPYVQFFGSFTGYLDKGTGLPVTGCFLTVTITPIPFTNRQTVEGPYRGVVSSVSSIDPLMTGGVDYNGKATGSGSGANVYIMRVNADGVVAVGPGAGAPSLPTTSPIAVAASPGAATLMFTAATQRSVTLQNVGVWPVACAAGTNAASVSLTRYSFVLAAGATAGDGTGGSYVVEQLPPGTTNGRVYCIGNGGAGSVAIMPQ